MTLLTKRLAELRLVLGVTRDGAKFAWSVRKATLEAVLTRMGGLPSTAQFCLVERLMQMVLGARFTLRGEENQKTSENRNALGETHRTGGALASRCSWAAVGGTSRGWRL